jgi:hypothetical protein
MPESDAEARRAMKPAAALLIAALSLGAVQDEWKPLPLSRAEQAPDSAATVGLALTPGPGAIDVSLVVDNPCPAKLTATYQPHGAVVKIRLIGPPADQRCPGHRLEAYQAAVTRLRPKRYQVIVYTADAKGRWHPWKAGVAEVP